MAGGRPEILNDALMLQICECIATGLSVLSACAYCNISRESYYHWKKLGKEKPDSIYGLFLANIKQADVQGEIRLLTDIQRDASWQSKAWILERRWPKKWGRKNIIKAEPVIKEKPTIVYNVKDLTDAELNKILGEEDSEDEFNT